MKKQESLKKQFKAYQTWHKIWDDEHPDFSSFNG
jgi:hypothetical protein